MKRRVGEDIKVILKERAPTVVASMLSLAPAFREVKFAPVVASVVFLTVFGTKVLQLTRQRRVQRVAQAISDEVGFANLVRMRFAPEAEDVRRELSDWFADLDRVDESVFDCMLALMRVGLRDRDQRYFVRSFRRVLGECDARLLRDLRAVINVALRHALDDGSRIAVYARLDEASDTPVLLAMYSRSVKDDLFGPYPGIRNSVPLFRMLKDADLADTAEGTVRTDRIPSGELRDHIRHDISFGLRELRRMAPVLGLEVTPPAPSPPAAGEP